MILWRISEHRTLNGDGGLAAGGRWHGKGRRIVYLAETSALAMLEVLIHLEIDRLPPPFQLIKVEAPDELACDSWPEEADATNQTMTRKWGEAWLTTAGTALAKVPSRIAPGGYNWLLNPAHADAGRVKIVASSHYPWDERLFRR